MNYIFKEDQEAHERCAANAEAYDLSREFQDKLLKLGIAWHNSFSGECTPDFACCVHTIGTYHTRIKDTAPRTINNTANAKERIACVGMLASLHTTEIMQPSVELFNYRRLQVNENECNVPAKGLKLTLLKQDHSNYKLAVKHSNKWKK